MTSIAMRALVVVAALCALAGPAEAQKSKDTLRVAFDQPIRLIDALHNPNPEANLIDRAVMDNLVTYDVKTKTFKGQLAESWTVVDDRTVDVETHTAISRPSNPQRSACRRSFSPTIPSSPSTASQHAPSSPARLSNYRQLPFACRVA